MIRLLVTGFGPFPGAPVNPTEQLMRRLEAERPSFDAPVALAIEILPTEYAGLPATLDRFGRAHAPDIAVHFGLAASAEAIRLESLARNVVAAGRADAAGFCPTDATICPGGADHPSTLPLDAIAAALTRAGIAHEPSDDCGAYLCNAIFYHAVGGLVPSYRPRMAGFVHVPHHDVLSLDALERAARIILSTTVEAFVAERAAHA